MARDFIKQWLADVRCLWNFHVVFDQFRNVDAIVCLGSYDLRVAKRCAELMLNGVSQIAVITGGYDNWTRGRFERPEAEIFAELIVGSGVAPDRLVIERN